VIFTLLFSEPGVNGSGGFEGGFDADKDSSPVGEEDKDSDSEDKGSDFSTGSSCSINSSSTCTGGVS
jgi:hypothetical protein